MPDPRRLASFLQRTQRAMQDAVNRGDQAGVDQYENFLDRGNAIGERILGQNQGQPVSNLPQAPQEPPQLGVAGPDGPAGAVGPASESNQNSGQPQFRPGSLVVPPKLAADVNGSKIANDINQESAPSKYSTPFVDKSPLMQMVGGIPQKPGTSSKPPLGPKDFSLSGPPGPYESPAPEPTMLKMIPELTALQGPEALGLSSNKGPGFLDSVIQAWAAPTNAVADFAEGFSSGFGKSLKDYAIPPMLQGNTTKAASSKPATGTSVSDANTPAEPDDEALAAMRYGAGLSDVKSEIPKGGYTWVNPNYKDPNDEEPKFFTLHRLAQILLTGAPSAVRSYDKEKEGFEQRQWAKDQRAYNTQQHQQDQSWHMQVQAMKDKIESQKAYAALLPHMVREQARAHLNTADLKTKQLDSLLRQIPAPDANDPRVLQLNREINDALQRADATQKQGFASMTGGNQ